MKGTDGVAQGSTKPGHPQTASMPLAPLRLRKVQQTWHQWHSLLWVRHMARCSCFFWTIFLHVCVCTHAHIHACVCLCVCNLVSSLRLVLWKLYISRRLNTRLEGRDLPKSVKSVRFQVRTGKYSPNETMSLRFRIMSMWPVTKGRSLLRKD